MVSDTLAHDAHDGSFLVVATNRYGHAWGAREAKD